MFHISYFIRRNSHKNNPPFPKVIQHNQVDVIVQGLDTNVTLLVPSVFCNFVKILFFVIVYFSPLAIVNHPQHFLLLVLGGRKITKLCILISNEHSHSKLYNEVICFNCSLQTKITKHLLLYHETINCTLQKPL